ncbi:MAG: hypothetical protein RBT71_05800 [Flavobacteriales bacterium]|jgi:hypothetical protein|nr:hypothetical protein [Flavobacteriales bacterium]
MARIATNIVREGGFGYSTRFQMLLVVAGLTMVGLKVVGRRAMVQ